MNFEVEIEQLFTTLAIPEAGQRFVRAALAEAPVRKASGRLGNALCGFSSPKTLERHHLLESRRGEWAMAVLLDRDPNVRAFLSQPGHVQLSFAGNDGVRRGTHIYTPDFLVFRNDGFDVLECRDEGRLVQDMARAPQQYSRDSEGRWHYEAAEKLFEEYGLRYSLVSNSSLPTTLVVNARMLEDYLRADTPPVEPATLTRLQALVAERRLVPFRELIGEQQFTADDIFKAIVRLHVYVDITVDRLDVPDELFVYSDRPTSDAHHIANRSKLEPVLPIPGLAHIKSGTKFRFDGKPYEVILSGEREVLVKDEEGFTRAFPLETVKQLHALKGLVTPNEKADTTSRQLAECSSKQLEVAQRKLAALKAGVAGGGASERSLKRYRALTRFAENDFDALMRLVDNQNKRGNRDGRVPAESEALAVEAIKKRYNQPENPTRLAAYATYVGLCKEATAAGRFAPPMSYATFCKRCNQRVDTRKRGGKRKAYQEAPIPLVLDHNIPIHGIRPHEWVYFDHTVANIAVVSPNGVDLGKPTLSMARDGSNRKVRAFILTFDPPSVKAVLLLMRDYVRRWGRLPAGIVTDNGAEFRSKEQQFFCDMYGIDPRFRPPGKPRGGAIIERAFGATEEEFFGQLQGNTRQLKDPRLVTKSVNGFNRAVWTLPALYDALEELLFDNWPNRIHPALGMTPNEKEAQQFQETGLREHTLVRFDENLMLMTSPHAVRRFHKVDRRRGVWLDGDYYTHPALENLRSGTKVEVRVEPWCSRVIYVYARDRWNAAISRNQSPYGGRTRRELEVALRQEKKRALLLAAKDAISAKQLCRRERLWVPENFDERLATQQSEMVYLYRRLNMAEALPSAAPAEAAPRPALPAPSPESPRDDAPTPPQKDAVALPQANRPQTPHAAAEALPVADDEPNLLEGIDGFI